MEVSKTPERGQFDRCGLFRKPALTTLGGDLSAYGRGDFFGEARKLIFTIAPEHEGVEAVADGKIGELIDPLLDWTAEQAHAPPVGDLAVDIEYASDVRGMAASRGCGIVDAGRTVAEETCLAT